jgi:alpha-L-fucosidase
MTHRRQFLGTSLLAAAALAVPSAAMALSRGPHRVCPTPQQLAWQREELAMFVHFSVNTYTGKEWGEGNEDPRLFNPASLDTRQWARTARDAGFGSLILTAKHHDGFCLWPSKLTAHSVASSPWRDGRGDVVREFVDACRAEGLRAGLYLSPWDRNAPSYGDSTRYNDFYVAQLGELLGQYGPLIEIWFDGANGEGPNGHRQAYDWPRFHRMVRRLQPNALMFSDAGPDLRWIGNESGVASETCWSQMDPASVPYPGFNAPGIGELLGRGDPQGSVWRPGETDVSIRPGWFWHAAENDKVRTADNLLDLYFTSVGRNSKLLLNVPPTPEGLLHATDVERLNEFAVLRKGLFADNLARRAKVVASGHAGSHKPARVLDDDSDSYWSAAADARPAWIELDLGAAVAFDVIELREAIQQGQHIALYRVDGWTNGGWSSLSRGTTIGHKKLDRIPRARARRIRVTIEQAFDTPRLVAIGLYHAAARHDA